MHLKALAAVSIAFTLGVQAVPNAFDQAAGLKRSHSHGMDMSRVSKRAMALVAKRQDSTPNRRARKPCTHYTTPSAPAPQQPETTPSTSAPQQAETTPPTPQQPPTTPDKAEPAPSPASNNNNNSNDNNGSGNSTPVNTVNTGLDVLSQEWLDQHNAARRAHGANLLTWSSTLADAAKSWGSRCVFEHSKGSLGPYGENLAAQTGSMSPTEGVKMWMDEVGDYNSQDPQPSHFTQVVWKSTTTLGCAIVECPAGTVFPGASSYYGVCEYSPPGNVLTFFPQNVQK